MGGFSRVVGGLEGHNAIEHGLRRRRRKLGPQRFDKATVAAGFIEDPREMISGVFKMMECLAAKEAEATDA